MRSARGAFAGVVLVSAHGGNADAWPRCAPGARLEGDAVWCGRPRSPGGDAHAGRTETSLLLAIDPSVVRLDLAEPGCTEPIAATCCRACAASGCARYRPTACWAIPRAPAAEEGRAILAALVDDLAAADVPVARAR